MSHTEKCWPFDQDGWDGRWLSKTNMISNRASYVRLCISDSCLAKLTYSESPWNNTSEIIDARQETTKWLLKFRNLSRKSKISNILFHNKVFGDIKKFKFIISNRILKMTYIILNFAKDFGLFFLFFFKIYLIPNVLFIFFIFITMKLLIFWKNNVNF